MAYAVPPCAYRPARLRRYLRKYDLGRHLEDALNDAIQTQATNPLNFIAKSIAGKGACWTSLTAPETRAQPAAPQR